MNFDLFILINSVLGILGQITKSIEISEIKNYIILLIAVLIGGQIGNFLNIKIFVINIYYMSSIRNTNSRDGAI